VTIRRGGTLPEADHQLLALIQRQLGHSNLGITSVLPAGHRQRRDHRDRPRPAPADDPSQHIPTALRGSGGTLLVAQSGSPVGTTLAYGRPVRSHRATACSAT
jgi:hypothetical protein